jgi:hypothetical protein
MTIDAFRYFFEHMPKSQVDKLDLFIHSDGGDATMPWRLMAFLREYAERVDVLVPYRAFSAATLAALGANRIVMHPMGTLGPIDPTVHDPYGPVNPQTGQPMGVSVEHVAAYNALVKDDVGIRHEDELVQAFAILAHKVHPLTLGAAKRGTAQARMLGGRLLRLRDPQAEAHRIEQLLEDLTRKLYYHGHPINRTEARDDLKLPVDFPVAAVEKAMWDLYVAYEEDMEMDRLFDPIADALRTPGFTIEAGQWNTADLPTMRLAVIESEDRADVLEHDLQVSVTRSDDQGTIAANAAGLRAEWIVDPHERA